MSEAQTVNPGFRGMSATVTRVRDVPAAATSTDDVLACDPGTPIPTLRAILLDRNGEEVTELFNCYPDDPQPDPLPQIVYARTEHALYLLDRDRVGPRGQPVYVQADAYQLP